ncbi:MAG: hypothetical protein IT256_04715 [Chitinophagaceae bacterium]|nr:hypothetical protein [Chitinophagaceae bacterium]
MTRVVLFCLLFVWLTKDVEGFAARLYYTLRPAAIDYGELGTLANAAKSTLHTCASGVILMAHNTMGENLLY